jgi:hypothetical protein
MMTAQKLADGSSDRTTTRRVNRAAVSWLVLLLALAGGTGHFLASSALAEGFRNPPSGAFNLGQAGGRTAQTDDSSSTSEACRRQVGS